MPRLATRGRRLYALRPRIQLCESLTFYSWAEYTILNAVVYYDYSFLSTHVLSYSVPLVKKVVGDRVADMRYVDAHQRLTLKPVSFT